jgi:hypothetical protein
MAKARKKAAKKSAHKSSKTRAKKPAAGQKRKPQNNKSFFDHLLSIFAGPDPRKT